jgi:hypothetical protein
MLIGRAAGRGAFKAAALVGAFAIIVAAWWWDAAVLTAAADANLQVIKIVTSKLPFDWGKKVESALRIFGASQFGWRSQKRYCRAHGSSISDRAANCVIR